jgi:UTP--glucose-1-phosphate uridylyltransferase
MSDPIRKAVIPAAGLGTRFLPATKVLPKEMLPVAGRPLIQYAVEEAAASGIDLVVLVIGKGKSLVSEHFHRDPDLEKVLAARGMASELEMLRQLSQLAEIRTVWQEKPLGLADAVRTARVAVGDEPFAVILPDALIDSGVPCTLQLIRCYEKCSGCVIATSLVNPEDTGSYGMLDTVPLLINKDDRMMRVTSMVERPEPGKVTSRYGIVGRYILTPEVFPCIEKTTPGFNGEYQLTDAIRLYSDRAPIYAYRIAGVHYDVGSQLGFLMATLSYASKDPRFSELLLRHLETLSWLRLQADVLGEG